MRYLAPYALVLLLWGRTTLRRIGAAACAIVTGLHYWGIWVVFDRWIWGDHATRGQGAAYQWATLLVVSTGFALAWGIARRWGRMWMVGLVVAPALAAVTYELQLHSEWWRIHLRGDSEGLHELIGQLVFIAPAVVAALVCWLLDTATMRRGSSDPAPEPTPEMKTSA